MPKLRKNQKDEVVRLIEQGFLDIEIKEKTRINTKTISKMRKALDKAQTSSSKDRIELPRHTLTKAQTLRLYGICHLEGGKDPETIMTELLEAEAKYRKKPQKPLEIHPEQIKFYNEEQKKETNLDEWIYYVEAGLYLLQSALRRSNIKI